MHVVEKPLPIFQSEDSSVCMLIYTLIGSIGLKQHHGKSRTLTWRLSLAASPQQLAVKSRVPEFASPCVQRRGQGKNSRAARRVSVVWLLGRRLRGGGLLLLG